MDIAFFYIGVFLFFRDIIQEIQGARPATARRASLQSRCAIGAAPLNIITIFVHKLLNIQIFLTFLVFFNLGNKS